MAFELPNRETFDHLQAELLKILRNAHSKIDVDYWTGVWYKWRYTIGGICGALAVSYLFVKASHAMGRTLKKRRLRFIVDEKQRQRDANIDQLHRRLEVSATPEVLARRRQIVLQSFDQLHQRLQKGLLSATEVLEAYQWRALEAQAQTNCVCEFLPEASTWAAALDARYSADDRKPPLFGIPISLSEAIEISGHDSTLGLVSRIDQPSSDDSAIVKTLKRLGAIPFVITNVSQGLLSMSCSNPIFGKTTNPHDPTRSCGGASGGEAALIAMRGSPLGVGLDSPGGGLRTPAHWCGICSLKPTSTRLSGIGRRSFLPDSSKQLFPIGPIGPTVDSLVAFMRTVCLQESAMFRLDPYTVPLAFDGHLYGDTSPLTIGYYHSDGLLTPLPACTRAVEVAKRILESRGHRLLQVGLPFDLEEMKDMLAAFAAIIMPDGGQTLAELFKNVLVDESIAPMLNFLATHQKGRLAKRCGSKRFSKIFNAFSKTVAEQEAIWAKIDQWRSKLIGFLAERSIDCLVGPALATTPLPAGQPEKTFFILWWYAAIFNLLDCPVGVVRCTNVTSADERAVAAEVDSIEDDWVSKELRKVAEGSVGLPVGVQCIAMPYREEICLRVMKAIEIGARI